MKNVEEKNSKIQKQPGLIRENVKLSEHTTFKIGGRARYFCAVKNKEDLIKAIVFAKKERLPFFILGGGSNLLVSDKGFNGIVIKIQNTEYRIQNTKISAGAGATLARLVSIAAEAGLSGLEWASGIPGATLGGAVRGNAGAFETEMKDLVKKAEAFDAKDRKIKNFDNKGCQFGYRKSIFKKNASLIILSVELELEKSDKDKVKAKAREILNYRKSRHPFYPSAGSIFKNTDAGKAAMLIHQCGLTGKKIGKAQISKKHSNFIVNLGGAKAKNVLKLIDLAKEEVKNKFGIKIEEEIQFLGKI